MATTLPKGVRVRDLNRGTSAPAVGSTSVKQSSDKRIPQLFDTLIRKVTGSTGRNVRDLSADEKSSILRLVRTIIASRYGHSVASSVPAFNSSEEDPDAFRVSEGIKRRLARRGTSGVDDAGRFAQLYRKILALPSRSRAQLPALMRLMASLMDVELTQRKMIGDSSTAKKEAEARTVEAMVHGLNLEETGTGEKAASGTRNADVPAAPSAHAFAADEWQTDLIEDPNDPVKRPSQLILQEMEKLQNVNLSPTVAEPDLVRDMIYVFQGISGRYITYEASRDRYTVNSTVGVPLTLRSLIQEMGEIGWYFRRIAAFIAMRTGQEVAFDHLRTTGAKSTVQQKNTTASGRGTGIAKAEGLVAQSFCGALSDELTLFSRLISRLEAQAYCNSNAGGLTLRRCQILTFDARQRLEALAVVCDGVKDTDRGGQLLNAVFRFTAHGDQSIRSAARDILVVTVQAYLAVMETWLFTGNLDDPYGEFFVALDPSVKESQVWSHKYRMRDDMRPAFISETMANQIMIIGKSIGFLRELCKDPEAPLSGDERQRLRDQLTEEKLQQYFASGAAQAAALHFENGKQTLQASKSNPLSALARSSLSTPPLARRGNEIAANTGDVGAPNPSHPGLIQALTSMEVLENLAVIVDDLHRRISERLINRLRQHFSIDLHLRALRGYLLFAQGDFIQALMESCEEELSKEAHYVHRHRLIAALENAIRAMEGSDGMIDAVGNETSEFTRRLDVRVLEPMTGDSGWDIFTLEYHLHLPLSSIITPEDQTRYLRAFSLLWRLKRAERSLHDSFVMNLDTGRQLSTSMAGAGHGKAVAGMLNRMDRIRAEMVHFVGQITYYAFYEVIECAWHDFEGEMRDMMSLDGLIFSHRHFLSRLMRGLFLEDDEDGSSSNCNSSESRTSEREHQLAHLRAIADNVLNFVDIQRSLFAIGSQLVEARRKLREDADARTDAGGWGMSAYESSAIEEREQRFIVHELHDFATRMEMCQRNHRELLSKLMATMVTANDSSLRSLAFRLDFNSYYTPQFRSYSSNLRSPARGQGALLG
eukprot:Clim_evm20s236 gene=Clim_evmTU20s236